jgi:hypothetical protein
MGEAAMGEAAMGEAAMGEAVTREAAAKPGTGDKGPWCRAHEAPGRGAWSEVPGRGASPESAKSDLPPAWSSAGRRVYEQWPGAGSPAPADLLSL